MKSFRNLNPKSLTEAARALQDPKAMAIGGGRIMRSCPACGHSAAVMNVPGLRVGALVGTFILNAPRCGGRRPGTHSAGPAMRRPSAASGEKS